MAAERKPAVDWSVVLGLLALAVGGCSALVMAAATILSRTEWRESDLAERFSRMIFSYGVPLDVVAVAFAWGAIRAGRRGKQMGVIAIALVVLSFLLLFVG